MNQDGTTGYIDVSVEVQNVGETKGKETVLFFVGQKGGRGVDGRGGNGLMPAIRPVRELKGFGKTGWLEPGETGRVEARLERYALGYWDERGHCWRCDEGAEFEVWAASSSRDLREVAEFRVERGVTWLK